MIRLLQCIGTLTVAFVPLAVAAAFPDVQLAHENGRAIEYLQQEGIMTGYPNGEFGPDRHLARAELMKILVESSVGTPDASYARSCFPDVRGDEWFAAYVCYAKDQGWVGGYPDGTFQPAKDVSLVETVKMLVNARGYEVPDNPRVSADWENEWYATYLSAASSNHVLSHETLFGYDEQHGEAIPRKRIAEFIYRALWNDGQIEMTLDLNTADCPFTNIIAVETSVEGEYPLNTQNIVAVMQNGQKCVLAYDVNPLTRVSKHLDRYLTPVYPSLEVPYVGSSDYQSTVVNGKAYFHIPCECDGGSLPGYFELDLQSGDFIEFLATPTLISEDYRFFLSVKDFQEIVVYDRHTNQTKTVVTLQWPLTLADQSYGPQDGMMGGMGAGNMRLSGHTFVYNMYNARQRHRDDVAVYEKMDTVTIDLDSFFD